MIYKRALVSAALAVVAFASHAAVAEYDAFQGFRAKLAPDGGFTVGFSRDGTPIVTSPGPDYSHRTGNFSTGKSSGGIGISGEFRVPYKGTTVSGVGRATVTTAELSRGMGKALRLARSATGGWIGVALLVSPAVIDWFRQAGISVKPDGSGFVVNGSTGGGSSPGIGVRCKGVSYDPPSWKGDPDIASTPYCVRISPTDNRYAAGWSGSSAPGSRYYYPGLSFPCGYYVCKTGYIEDSLGTTESGPEDVLKEATLEEVESQLAKAPVPDPAVLDLIREAGGDPVPGEVSITVDDQEIEVSKSTATMADGSVVTTRVTQRATSVGNKVKVTRTTTVTTTKPDGTTSTETRTETSTEQLAPNDDFCRANPRALACLQLGAPQQEKLPTRDVPVTVPSVGFASAATCPAPVTFSYLGRPFAVSYQPLCDRLPSVRAVMIALSAFAASVIFVGGLKT